MARKNPLSDREKAVCARLREFRIASKLSQVAFARSLAVDSSLLASYEHARVPLRYEFARHCNTVFGVNLRWLADGVEPKILGLDILGDLESKIPSKLPFLEAYDTYLKPSFDDYFSKIDDASSRFPSDDLAPDLVARRIKFSLLSQREFEQYGFQLIREQAEWTPPNLYKDLLRQIAKCCDKFEQDRADQYEQFYKHLDSLKKSNETSSVLQNKMLSHLLRENYPVSTAAKPKKAK